MADRMRLGASDVNITDLAVMDHTGTPSDSINDITGIKSPEISEPSISTPSIGMHL